MSGGTRRLLHDVLGYVKPGTLTALMGASGAGKLVRQCFQHLEAQRFRLSGKTTCLDVLAQRKNIGVIQGDMLVGEFSRDFSMTQAITSNLTADGRPIDSDFARGTAYAEQMDVHEGTSTVREAMRFSAYLRQPFTVSQEEKDAYVEEIIELLELQDLAEALVFSLGVEGTYIASPISGFLSHPLSSP